MNDWLRRLGAMLVSGLEVLLALAVLGAFGLLIDIQAGVESGAYNREVTSGFVVRVPRGLGALIATRAALVASHGIARTVLAARDEGFAPVRQGALRVVVELLVALLLYVVLLPEGTADGVFGLLVGASGVVAIGVLVQVAVNALRLAWGVSTHG